MEDVYPHLYVGSDEDYWKLKQQTGWSFVRACKFGPGGHQQTLGYTTPGAPKDENYLSVRRGNRVALNMIDLDDPNYFSPELINAGLDFIHEQLEAGKKVLVACNKGHSRGPSIAMLYLRKIGELPYSFVRAETIFRTLYPAYDPAQGVRQAARQMWAELGRAEDGEMDGRLARTEG